jgi:dihydroorotase
MNLGAYSTRLGLRGVSSESEFKRIERDIELARQAQCRVHIAHVSCAESVAIIAKAKKAGVLVSAETAPHYCALTEEAVVDYDTNKKMNPPLRSERDRQAVLEGLRTGVLDAVASDHAPHTISEKDIEFDRAEFGVTGLETELAAMITFAVNPGILSWADLVKVMSENPARILGVDRGHLSRDAVANVIVVDPKTSWEVMRDRFVSKSKNSAFLGKRLCGVVEYTIYNGRVVYQFNA